MNDTQHILTPAIQQNICNCILAGGFPEVAAEAAGIPAKVFTRWMRFGEAKRPIPLYRDFVQSVRQAQAQVRIVAEHKALEKSPVQWLKSGPGKETARLPGWTSPVRPPQQTRRKKGLSAEQMQGLISTLLAALGPFPEARQAAAEALINGGWVSDLGASNQAPGPAAEADVCPKAGEEGNAPAGEPAASLPPLPQPVQMETKQLGGVPHFLMEWKSAQASKSAVREAVAEGEWHATAPHSKRIEDAFKVQRTAGEGESEPGPQWATDLALGGGFDSAMGWDGLESERQPLASTANFRECIGQTGDVCLSAERAGADAHRAIGESPQRSVDVGSAVQAGTHGDVERLIENAAQLRRGQHFAAEAQRAHTPAGVAMAEHLETRQRLQTPPQLFRQGNLMFANAANALLDDIGDARRQAGDAEDVRRAALEEVRQVARLRLARRVAARAALAPGRHAGARADVQHSGASR